MRFVVLGAGALGTVIAAYLARAGEDVALIARGARAKQLAKTSRSRWKSSSGPILWRGRTS